MERGELFIEILCEELPAGWGAPALSAFIGKLEKLLEGVPHGAARGWRTPRRLAVRIQDVDLARPVEERLVTGPPWAVAFRDGQFTKAAMGFARGRGKTVSDLEKCQGKKGPVVGLRLTEGGEHTVEVLGAGLEAAILAIPFPKTLRWGSGSARWARPIHGVCALLGGQRVPARVAGLDTVTHSRGHRRAPGTFAVEGAQQWLLALLERFVQADHDERKAGILSGLHAAAAEQGVRIEPDPELLDEVNDLVEWPVVVAGRLPEHLMHLPSRLLVESMRVHQRIFDTLSAEGELSPVFLTVSNNPHGDSEIISAGNTRVLTARFEDARFFYDEDRKLALDEHAAELQRMRWVRGLGTVADKATRLGGLGRQLAGLFGADPDAVDRAAQLCKADLATHMVGEFPELQGHVGRLYAQHQGERAQVALAIEEHYLPRFAEDDLPSTPAGRSLALADRLDSLGGCFAIGLVPKGNDPQGLRRAANGALAILRKAGVSVSLAALFDDALQAFEAQAKRPLDQARQELVDFALARLRAQLLDEAIPTAVADAVLAAGGDDPLRLGLRAQALSDMASGAEFGPLRTAFRRVMGLSKDHPDSAYDPQVLAEPAERALHAALLQRRGQAQAKVQALDYAAALAAMAHLKEPVDQLFDEVLVMCEDRALRDNRLGLLRAVADLFRTVADFTQLAAEN